MNAILSRMITAGLLFLLTFIFGFWLSRSDKPYGVVIFTIHKLIALGAVIFLGITLYKEHQLSPLSPGQIAAALVMALCFLSTILTGGLLSIEKPVPAIVLIFHRVLPYLTVVSTAVVLYWTSNMHSSLASLSH